MNVGNNWTTKVDFTSSKIFKPSSIPIPLADVIEDLFAYQNLI